MKGAHDSSVSSPGQSENNDDEGFFDNGTKLDKLSRNESVPCCDYDKEMKRAIDDAMSETKFNRCFVASSQQASRQVFLDVTSGESDESSLDSEAGRNLFSQQAPVKSAKARPGPATRCTGPEIFNSRLSYYKHLYHHVYSLCEDARQYGHKTPHLDKYINKIFTWQPMSKDDLSYVRTEMEGILGDNYFDSSEHSDLDETVSSLIPLETEEESQTYDGDTYSTEGFSDYYANGYTDGEMLQEEEVSEVAEAVTSTTTGENETQTHTVEADKHEEEEQSEVLNLSCSKDSSSVLPIATGEVVSGENIQGDVNVPVSDDNVILEENASAVQGAGENVEQSSSPNLLPIQTKNGVGVLSSSSFTPPGEVNKKLKTSMPHHFLDRKPNDPPYLIGYCFFCDVSSNRQILLEIHNKELKEEYVSTQMYLFSIKFCSRYVLGHCQS